MVIETRKTADGSEYQVLKTPGNMEYQFYTNSEHKNEDGFKFHHIYLKCSELKNKLLPIDADPREPFKNAQIGEIQSTLIHFPKKFHKRNNGITVICDNVTYDQQRKICKLDFGSGRGICNGGHTYFSIVTVPEISEDALVHLELIQLPETMSEDNKRDYIVDIARCRNNNMRLKLQSQADYQGYYEIFKKRMKTDTKDDTKMVIWHEGDSNAYPNAIKSEDLVRFMATLDPTWFYHPIFNNSASAKSHRIAASSVEGIHTRWFSGMEDESLTQKPLEHMSVLINEILSIRDMLSYSLQYDGDLGNFRKSSLWKNWLKGEGMRKLLLNPSGLGLKIPPTFEILLLGLFRSNIWLGLKIDETVRYIGWYRDHKELWNLRKKDVLARLASSFNDFNQEPITFIRSDGAFRDYLYVFGTEGAAPLPRIVYDTNSGRKYVEDTDNPTHFLDLTGEVELKPISGETQKGMKTFRVE